MIKTVVIYIQNIQTYERIDKYKSKCISEIEFINNL